MSMARLSRRPGSAAGYAPSRGVHASWACRTPRRPSAPIGSGRRDRSRLERRARCPDLRRGAAPAQSARRSPRAAMVWDPAVPGEDCLNLNVWTPDPAAHGLPVMVWIPGGMFEVGTGASYDGSRFARDGIVCVTINYRVGPEGFLYLADGDANLGLLDQIAALEWVRDNIAAFGGDPDNVTIFGESAGAMSVGTLLAVPRAEGLFRRAIAQSGAADRVIPAATALRIGRDLAERLGIEATREAMSPRSPPDRLLIAAAELKGDLVAHPDPERWSLEVVASMLPWQPVIDGDVLPGARSIASPPAPARASTSWSARTPTTGGCSWSPTARWNGSPTRSCRPGRDHGFEAAPPTGCRTTTWPPIAPPIRAPARASCSRRSRPTGGAGSRRCAWPTPTPRHDRPPTCTSSPGLAAFGGASVPATRSRSASCSTPSTWAPTRCSGRCSADPPQTLADTMHRAWVAFAATGDPGWPRYDLDRRATMRFDSVSRVVDDPRWWERAAVERYP